MKARGGKYRVLVVDDEALVIAAVQQLLQDQLTIEVIGCSSGAEALERVKKSPYGYALILMDYRLPDLSGSRATAEILKMNPDQIVAMNSGDEMSNFPHIVPPNFLNTVPLDFHDCVPVDFLDVVPRYLES